MVQGKNKQSLAKAVEIQAKAKESQEKAIALWQSQEKAKVPW